MNVFGFSADRAIERVRLSGEETEVPSLGRSIWLGALGFCWTSLIVFGSVALAKRAVFGTLGEGGAYAAWALLFVVLGGGALSRVVIGPRRLGRFYLLFGAGFLLYAASWTGAYLTLRGITGELIGSVIGSLMMGLLITGAFKAWDRTTPIIAGLMVSSLAGYLAGRTLYFAVHDIAGLVLWGFVYGALFGAGFGYALYHAQARIRGAMGNQ